MIEHELINEIKKVTCLLKFKLFIKPKYIWKNSKHLMSYVKMMFSKFKSWEISSITKFDKENDCLKYKKKKKSFHIILILYYTQLIIRKVYHHPSY